MSKSIKISCEGTATVDYLNLVDFQGDLKELNEKGFEALKAEILRHGFAFPVIVWKNKGKHFIVDGHQRVRTVRTLVERFGYACPELPIVEVKAKTLKEAKELLLAATSQYGEMTRQGLYEFMEEAGIKMAEVKTHYKFADIDLHTFQAEFYVDLDKKKEEKLETTGGDKVTKEVTFTDPIVHKCPKCSAKFTCTPVKKN